MVNREELSIVLNQKTIFALINSSHAGILLRSYRIEKKSALLIRITYGALGGGRTHTWRIFDSLLRVTRGISSNHVSKSILASLNLCHLDGNYLFD